MKLEEEEEEGRDTEREKCCVNLEEEGGDIYILYIYIYIYIGERERERERDRCCCFNCRIEASDNAGCGKS